MSKEETEVKVEPRKKSSLVSIKPLKDFVIHMNEFHYDIKEGKEIKVHEMFLVNLKTEKVIK